MVITGCCLKKLGNGSSETEGEFILRIFQVKCVGRMSITLSIYTIFFTTSASSKVFVKLKLKFIFFLLTYWNCNMLRFMWLCISDVNLPLKEFGPLRVLFSSNDLIMAWMKMFCWCDINLMICFKYVVQNRFCNLAKISQLVDLGIYHFNWKLAIELYWWHAKCLLRNMLLKIFHDFQCQPKVDMCSVLSYELLVA